MNAVTDIKEKYAHDRANFIGYTYCPLKLTFRDSFEEVLKSYQLHNDNMNFTYYVPTGCTDGDPYEDIWKAESIDQLPDIIASVGFGDFFRQEFVEGFIYKDYFKAVPQNEIHKSFVSAGLVDPKGWYTVYSVLPLVMLIDRKKLGNLPMPKRWSDLLNPVYKNNIIIGASHGDFHEDLFLYIYKEHGEEGVVKIANNIKSGCHASHMAKMAGTNNSEGAAVYVIPWIFAKSCPRNDVTEVIWPEDGALTTPIYLLTKEFAFEKYKPIVDFIIGYAYGEKCAHNYFPVMNAKVDNRLPEGAVLKWLGWDYIRKHSIHELMEYVMRILKRVWTGNTEVKEMVL